MAKDNEIIKELIEKINNQELITKSFELGNRVVKTNQNKIKVTSVKQPVDLPIANEWLTPEQCEEVRKIVGKHDLGDFSDGESFLDLVGL